VPFGWPNKSRSESYCVLAWVVLVANIILTKLVVVMATQSFVHIRRKKDRGRAETLLYAARCT
jgi:hypothetical protein